MLLQSWIFYQHAMCNHVSPVFSYSHVVLSEKDEYFVFCCLQSRDIDRTKKDHVLEANKYFFVEAAIALFVSFLINVFVTAVFAEGFYGRNVTQVVCCLLYTCSLFTGLFSPCFFFLGPSMLANSFILSWIRPDTVVHVKREIIWDIWITGSHVLNSPTDNEGENKAANVFLYTLNGIY